MAYETLAMLKIYRYRDTDQQRELSVLQWIKHALSTSSLSNDRVAQMSVLSKAIDNCADNTLNNKNNTNVEDKMGVSMVFNDDSKDEDGQD